MTIRHAAWRIIKDPNIRILIVSALDKTAKDFFGALKELFQNNPGIKKYFPEFHVPGNTWGTVYEFRHPMRDVTYGDPNPTARATYLGAANAGWRADIILVDDPIDKEHVATPEQADKAMSSFNQLIPLVDNDSGYGMMFVSGTRKSHNDVFAAILGENRGEDTSVELAGKELRYDCKVRHCLEKDGKPDFEAGTPIFPKRFTKASLLNDLEEYKNDPKRGEAEWWREMMNICMAPSEQKFEETWIDNWVPVLPGNIVWSGIALDSATKDEQVLMKGDYTAAHVGHFDSYGHLYLTDAIHRNDLRSPDLMKALAASAQRHNTCNILKEKVGEEMFFGMVTEAFINLGLPCRTYPLGVRGQGKKVVRITEALQAPFMSGKIHFVGNRRDVGYPIKVWRALRDELTHLSQWSHDDLADALSLFYHKDIRVRPSSTTTSKWDVPRHARIPQRGTHMSNPAAAARWAGPPPSAVSPPPTRADPFLNDRYGAFGHEVTSGTGDDISIDPVTGTIQRRIESGAWRTRGPASK
jgi:hypothetical protein